MALFVFLFMTAILHSSFFKGFYYYITTDRGGQFVSSLWAQLMAILGTTHCCTTSYHPQSNGLLEQFHHQLKGALKVQLDVRSWTESLSMILLGICTALKDDLHCTAAELVYGVSLRLPGEFFSPSSLSLSLSFTRRRVHYQTQAVHEYTASYTSTSS